MAVTPISELPPAVAFLQEWLDRLAMAFFANDYDAYAGAVSLPFTVRTEGGVMVVRNNADLRRGFDAWVGAMKSQSITRMERTAIEANWLGQDGLKGMYETRLWSDKTEVVPAFRSLIELLRHDGLMQARTVVNDMKNITWPITLPLVAPKRDKPA